MSGSYTVTVINNSTETNQRSLVLTSGNIPQHDNLADSNTELANNNTGEPNQDVNLQPSVQSANQDLDMAGNIISSSNLPPDQKANSNTDFSAENNAVDKHEINQESAHPETHETHGTNSSGHLTSAVQPLSDMESDVEMDVVPVSQSSSSVSTLASSLSDMSISPTENSIGGILDTDNQIQSSCDISRMSKKDDNDQGKIKRDFVIINHEAAEKEAENFKKHLKSDAIGIPDLTVDLLSSVGIGHSNVAAVENLPNEYHSILMYVTNTVDPDNEGETLRLQFYSHLLIDYGFSYNLSNKVIPVWTYKKAQKECKNICLRALKGLPYWKFADDGSKDIYIESVQNLVKKGRGIQS